MKLYYCNINNFGDALNRYIFKKCFNVDAEYKGILFCDSTGIGSVLEHALFQLRDFVPLPILPFLPPLDVISSAFAHPDKHYKNKPRFLYTMFFKRRMNFISLRGKRTKESVERILKKELKDVMLGDLGLLSSELLEEKSATKIYDLGICPHYHEKGHPLFEKILEMNPKSVILDTEENPIEFLKKLNQCKAVISTGMHPLIAADSLGIPNLWARIHESTTSRHKYWDYYSVYDIADPEPYDLLQKDSLRSDFKDFIIQNYKIDSSKVASIKQNLLEGHKKYFANRKR